MGAAILVWFQILYLYQIKNHEKIQYYFPLPLLFSTVALAQLPVIRSTFTGPYTPINMPAATLSTASGDDDVQSAIPLGFTFNYLGINYTTIGVSTNGVASFSAVMSPQERIIIYMLEQHQI